MTSRKSLANKGSAEYDFLQAIKLNIAPTIMTFVVMAYFFIVDTISSIGVGRRDIEVNKEALETLRKTFACIMLGEYSNEFLPFVCIIFGILFAIFNASYILAKKNANFYYSLPINRSTMFKNRIIAPVLCMACVLLITIAADVMINTYYFQNFGFIFKIGLCLFAESFVYMLSAFVIVTIAFSACYTIIEGLFFGAGLIWLPTIVVTFFDNLFGSFLYGYARREVWSDLLYFADEDIIYQNSLIKSTAIINPLIFGSPSSVEGVSNNIFSFAHQGNYNYDYETGEVAATKLEHLLPDMKYIVPIIVWAVLSVAGIFVARHLFINRKAESIALHGSNKIATNIFVLEVALSVSSFLVYAFKEDYIITNAFLNILILVAVSLLVYFIMMAICQRKIKPQKSTLITAAVTSCCVIVISGVLTAGGFGYSNYIPDVDEIECATITNGIIDITHSEKSAYSYNDLFPTKWGYNNNCIGVFDDKDDLNALVDVVSGVLKKTDNMMNARSTVVYKLKNGKTVYRKYTSIDKEAVFNILSLTDTKAYNEELRYLFALDDKKKSDMSEKADKLGLNTGKFIDNGTFSETEAKFVFSDGFVYVEHFQNGDNTTAIKNTVALREALYKDLEQSSFEKRFKPDEKEICCIYFSSYDNSGDSIYDEKTAEEYEYYYDYDQYAGSFYYRVYPSMKNTVEYLKSVNALEEKDYFKKTPAKAYVVKYKDGIDMNIYAGSYKSYLFEGSTIGYPKEDLNDLYEYDYYFDSLYKNGYITEKEDEIKELIDVCQPYRYACDDDYVVLFEDENGDVVDYTPMIIPQNKVMDKWVK